VSEVYRGVVKAVVERGFCFLSPPPGYGKDIFGHFRQWESAGLRTPEKGEEYYYQIEQTEKGPQAHSIRPVL
jgi:cold shock CspA family protein